MDTMMTPTATELTWKTRKVAFQAGEYKESTIQVTEHYTTDGRFTICPRGGMSRRRENGVRGQLVHKFRFTGYIMTDSWSDLPTYIRRHASGYTVSELKRQATRRAIKGGI